MNRPNERWTRLTVMPALALSATFALMAGCSMMGSSGTHEGADRDRAGTAQSQVEPGAADGAAAAEQSPEAAQQAGAAAAGQSPETAQQDGAGDNDAATPVDPFTELLAERRRRDYPEFETTDTGFMISEQIRIAADVRADYQRALQWLGQGNHQQGIDLLRTVIEGAPGVTAPYIDLGIAYGMTGELELAEEALLQASQLSPNHPIVLNELGILYRRMGRFEEARQAYERALEVYPGFHFARRNLAVLCDLYLADLECALANYEAYLEGVLADEEVEIWVADIRNRLGQ